ncbi:MAG: Xaa-Pro peptidase family protein [Caldilineaceae bacterium]|nr:Xaa-Pro peptidase family protein [Caldilineaceae bacterium]
MKYQISDRELERRVGRMRAHMEQQNLEGLVVFGATRTFYLSGFHHLATERPVVLVVPLRGELALLVPHLEEENIPVRNPNIKEMKVYREYPGLKHPMVYLAELLGDKGLAESRLGVDSSGWGGGMGYRGPDLSEVLPKATLVNVRDVIDDMRAVKSAEEIELIRLSAMFGNVTHGFLQDYIEPGAVEVDVAQRASRDGTAFMIKALPESWEPYGRSEGAAASFTSGPKTAFNHRRAGRRRLKPGDVILTYAGAEVGGYTSELERTLMIEPLTDDHRKYFDLEVQAQDVAFDAIRPGARMCDVEKAVNAFLEENGLYSLTRTHIGHAIGIEGHEGPFLDLGDQTEIQVGFCLTVEPCLFLPGFAGFRHSDTVVVTEDGIDMITYYPRDIESLTIPA